MVQRKTKRRRCDVDEVGWQLKCVNVGENKEIHAPGFCIGVGGKGSAEMESADRQLVVAVEGTAAMGPFWNSILSDYLENIVRSFLAAEVAGQKNSAAAELALVVFNAHGPHSACLVQRSGWTRDVDVFLHWLGSIRFSGGGFGEVAIAEGLAETLMMFSSVLNGTQAQHSGDCQKHCILFAASNPYSLPTPVSQIPYHNMEQQDRSDIATENCLVDAEAVAKYFAQCVVSLSVISPKQLPKLKAIYNMGKRNPRVSEPAVENIKNPHFLVLLSENFLEARAALNKSGIANMPATQVPMKVDTNSGTPMPAPSRIANPSANGSVIRQPISMGNISTATVKVEPSTVPTVVSGSGFSHMPTHTASQGSLSLPASAPMPTSQESLLTSDLAQEVKPVVTGLQQQIRPPGAAAANVSILNNISSQARVISSGANPIGLQNMGNTPMAMHMSNMISTGMTSSALPTSQSSLSSVSSGITSISGSGPVMGSAQISQNSAPNSFSSANMNITGNSNMGVQPSVASGVQGTIGTNHSITNMGPGNLPSGAQIGQNGITITPGMTGLGISSGVVGMIPTPGMSQQVGMQPLNNGSGPQANMSLPQIPSGGPQQSKYLKVWEGALSGQRQGQPVYICRLEGYRNATASDSLANDWPGTMQIVRLISQDHMSNKQYLGKADFLVFRALNQHGFLTQLQEKKLCAVIQLPSQTLLLSVSEKASRLIGMLFPGDMVVFKPQVPSQQQLQPPIGVGMNQQFLQGHGRAQVMQQGQLPNQGLPNMPNSGFLP